MYHNSGILSNAVLLFIVGFLVCLFLQLTERQMARNLQVMTVVITSENKLSYDEYVLLPEDGEIHKIINDKNHMTPVRAR